MRGSIDFLGFLVGEISIFMRAGLGWVLPVRRGNFLG